MVTPQKSNVIQITGEVVMPKSMAFEAGMTLDNYLAAAGGVSDQGGAKHIIVEKQNEKVGLAEHLGFIAGNRIAEGGYEESPSGEGSDDDCLSDCDGNKSSSGSMNIIKIVNGSDIKIVKEVPGLKVNFLGDNSILELHEPVPKFHNSEIAFGSHSFCRIGGSQYKIKNLKISRIKDRSKVIIGKNFSCEEVSIPMHGETGLSVTIGDECMFSHGITISPSDFHAIISIESGEPLNFGADITIGNHVWIAPQCNILKGTSISDDSVVASYSLVNKSFEEENVLIGGVPAKILKKGITWSRDNCQWVMKKRKVKNGQ